MTDIERKSAVLYGGQVTVDFTPGNHRFKVAGCDEHDWWPSVTAVSGMLDKPQLVPWAVKMAVKHLREWAETHDHATVSKNDLIDLFEAAGQRHEIERNRAGDIGKAVHAWCEMYGLAEINKGAPPAIEEAGEEPAIVLGVKAFTDFLVGFQPTFVHAEEIVCSVKHGYVGIMDSVMDIAEGKYAYAGQELKLKGGRYVVDYKTSKGIYPETYIQTAGYQGAYEEQSGEQVVGRIILRLDKETGMMQVAVREGRQAFWRDLKVFIGLLSAKRLLRDLEADLKNV